MSEEVLDAVTSIAEESGRTVERRFGSTSDNTMLDEAQVLSLNAIERLLRAMIGSLETGVLTVADTGTSLAGSYLDENRAASLTAVAQSVGAEVSLAPPAPLGSAEIDALNDDIVELLIGNPISFISGSAEFVWGSDGVLDEIAQLLVDVPAFLSWFEVIPIATGFPNRIYNSVPIARQRSRRHSSTEDLSVCR